MVAVGDPWQSIYAFHGAVDAMQAMAAPTLHLSCSWRFGPALARMATAILQQTGRPPTMAVRGRPDRDGMIERQRLPGPCTVLCRTNAALFEAARLRLGDDLHLLHERGLVASRRSTALLVMAIFVVLLRCPSEGEASDVYERFRANLQSYGFPQVGTVTASLGFTEIRSNDTPQSAFERADKAVYYAKQHGRNQIISFHDLVRRGILEEVINVNDDAELF